MREIKFRAWDEPDGLHRDVGSMAYYSVHDSIGDVDVIMQWTGLFDKKGKEIYEGDIIKTTFKGKEAKIMTVDWDGCNPCFVLSTIPNKPGFGEYDFIQCGLRENEIIGNIYETPELINK